MNDSNGEFIDLTSIPSIDVSNDSKIKNQDAREMHINKGNGDISRNGDLFLGNDGIQLPNQTYISQDALLEAIQQCVERHDESKEVSVVISGKKISAEDIDAIKKATESASYLFVSQNKNMKRIDGRNVSVSVDGKEKVQGGLMFKKDAENAIPDGKYVPIDSVEIKTNESIETSPILIEVEPTTRKPNPKKRAKALAVGLAIGAVTLPVVLQGIMHANSIIWHHSPETVQEILHSVNLFLGKITGSSYTDNGVWTNIFNNSFNIKAATEAITMALSIYGIDIVGIGAIKHYFSKNKKNKLDEQQLDMESGGMSR